MDEGLSSMEIESDFDSEFTLAEIVQMENLYKEVGEESLNKQFCQELATKFSCSTHRCGKSFIKWEQVHSWFQDTRKELETQHPSLHQKLEEYVAPTFMKTDESATESEEIGFHLHDDVPKLAYESSKKPKAERASELSELIFEAKSFKDFAWYDVASFINYRVTSSGELEVRVRFAGFGKDEDEWVNVKRGVRERSIPLEHSECDRVKVGDLVLCFREYEDHAVHCDAYVVEIQRSLHDDNGCSCIFIVHYDFDNIEEKVPVSKLCCRPT